MARAAQWAVALGLLAAGSVVAAPPEGRAAIRGTLSVVQEDDFARGRTARVHTLFEDGSGQAYTLHFGAAETRLRTGTRLVARGRLVGRDLYLDSTASDAVEVTESAAATALEMRRAVVLVVNFSDSAVTCSDASIAGLMFTGSSSVDGLYQAASFGKVGVLPDVDGNGSPDVFRVNVSNTVAEACDAYAWAAAAETAAQAAGVNLALYQHRIFVLPGNTTCSWAGLGNVGCGTYCRAWVKTCNLQDVYAHEIGHNLDLAHASTDPNNDGAIDCEYCDKSDIMGYGGVGWRIFSAPHEDQKQWMPAAKVQQVSVAGTATYVISPLQANPETTSYPQILKIRKADTNDWYYLGYRQRQGYDASLSSEYVDRVSVHRYVGSGYSNTRLLAALGDGQVFDDLANGLSIRQVAHDALSATLQITTTCTPVAPTVLLSPSRQVGQPGVQVSFTATVTNRDPGMCGSSSFDLSSAGPAGFALSLSSPSLTLAPGAQGSVTLRSTSPAAATDGDASVSLSARGANGQAVHAVDGTPPSAVNGLTAAAGRKGVVTVSWPASSDAGSGIASYRLYRNGTLLVTTSSRTYDDRTATTAGTYAYTALAVDGAGNVSAAGNTAQFTVSASTGGGKRPR